MSTMRPDKKAAAISDDVAAATSTDGEFSCRKQAGESTILLTRIFLLFVDVLRPKNRDDFLARLESSVPDSDLSATTSLDLYSILQASHEPQHLITATNLRSYSQISTGGQQPLGTYREKLPATHVLQLGEPKARHFERPTNTIRRLHKRARLQRPQRPQREPLSPDQRRLDQGRGRHLQGGLRHQPTLTPRTQNDFSPL